MYGRPNAIVTNPDFIKTGKLDKYTVYGKDGTAVKEVRLTGKDYMRTRKRKFIKIY